MRINELILESSEVDEGIGATIGKGIGAVGRGIGAVASVPQGLARAIKKGYKQGVDTIAGDTPTQGEPASAPSIGAPSAVQPKGFAQGFKQGFSGTSASTAAPTGTTSPTTAAAPAGSPAQSEKIIQSLQFLKPAEAEQIKKMLAAKAGLSESQLDELTFSGLKQGAGAVLNRVKGAAKAAPSAIATAAGGAVGGLQGMGRAASKAYRSGKEFVGGGELTFNEIQRMIATMSAADAKEMLTAMQSLHPDAPATSPSKAVDTSHPADDNPNIGLGANESKVIVFRSRFLGMDI